MTVAFIVFIIALGLLATRFLFKQSELTAGVQGRLTRTLSAHSPVWENRYDRFAAHVAMKARAFGARTEDFGRRALAQLRATTRGLVVVVAARMVRSVRGEKMLYSQTTPSLYLKRLKGEMDKKEEVSDDKIGE
ncbi:MAG: hypothetical protein AAB458_01005 [Patescibacteria group bacterium]